MGIFRDVRPYILMILLQVFSGFMIILTKRAFEIGFKTTVLVVYRHVFATMMATPFALYFERKRPKLTFAVFLYVFFLGLIGIAMTLNLYYAGLRLSSPTIAAALVNLIPALTFVMTILFKMEKINIRERSGFAKILGSMICIGGAMVMTFYEGPALYRSSHHAYTPIAYSSSPAPSPAPLTIHHNTKEFLIGFMLLILATLCWATFFILQSLALRKYPVALTLTTLICLMGSIQSAVYAAIAEPHVSSWSLGLNAGLLCALYSALAGSIFPYYFMGICIREKGVVFATSFSPLSMIFVVILGFLFLHESIFLGSVLGGVVMSVGLFIFLWGKSKDFVNR